MQSPIERSILPLLLAARLFFLLLAFSILLIILFFFFAVLLRCNRYKARMVTKEVEKVLPLLTHDQDLRHKATRMY